MGCHKAYLATIDYYDLRVIFKMQQSKYKISWQQQLRIPTQAPCMIKQLMGMVALKKDKYNLSMEYSSEEILKNKLNNK